MLSNFIFSIIFCSCFLQAFSGVKPKIVFLIAEREYRTESSLPKFAQDHLTKEFDSSFCSAPEEGPSRHFLSNTSFIPAADLLIISVRRRAFPEKTMNMIQAHIESGKPVVGIRTASHPFELRKEEVPKGHAEWTKWDAEVIGGNYNGHLGKGLICVITVSYTHLTLPTKA